MSYTTPIASAVSARIAQFNKSHGGQTAQDEHNHSEREQEFSNDSALRGCVMVAADSFEQAISADMGGCSSDLRNLCDRRLDPENASPSQQISTQPRKQKRAEPIQEDTKEEEDDQFMRIQVAATTMKPVSKVKKDKYHDRPDKKRGNGIGLTRMLSSVKISDLGQPKGRPGLGSVGRMLSMTKEKKNAESTSASAASPNPMKSQVSDGSDHKRLSSRGSNRSHPPMIDRPRTSQHSTFPEKTKSALTRSFSVAAKPSANRTQEGHQSPGANLGDRRRSGIPNASRLSLGHVGGTVSFSRKRLHLGESQSNEEVDPISDVSSAGSLVDGATPRRETETKLKKKPSRMTFKQVGRLLSKSRISSTNSSHAASMPASQVASLPEGSSNRKLAQTEARNAPEVQTSRNDGSLKSGSSLGEAGRLPSSTRKSQNAALKQRRQHKMTEPLHAKRSDSAGIRKSGSSLTGSQLQYFFTPLTSQAVRSSGCLGERTHLRIPVLHMAPYSSPISTTAWHLDAVTLAHNAFRRELVDFYVILSSIGRSPPEDDLTQRDILSLKQWWTTANDFFQSYFTMETKVLFPWIETALHKESDSDNRAVLRTMAAERAVITEGLGRVSAMLNEANSRSPAENFAKIYTAMDQTVYNLAGYFNEQEEKLPRMIEEHYALQDRLKMDKDLLEVFIGEPIGKKTRDIPRLNVVILIRWLQNPRQLKAWIAKNLNATAKNRYPKWRQNFEENHRSIVNSFQAKHKAVARSKTQIA